MSWQPDGAIRMSHLCAARVGGLSRRVMAWPYPPQSAAGAIGARARRDAGFACADTPQPAGGEGKAARADAALKGMPPSRGCPPPVPTLHQATPWPSPSGSEGPPRPAPPIAAAIGAHGS
jgi:hypothetical protein